MPMSERGARASSAAYLLGLADDAMVYAQRLGEWLATEQRIQEDATLGTIALDLRGHARALYARVVELDGRGWSEDDYVVLRAEHEWRNVHLVEQERDDFGREMTRLLCFAAYQCELYAALLASSDPVLAGVSKRALEAVRRHREHARQWVVRLGAGGGESHRRMQEALEWLGPYGDEVFEDDPVSVAAAASRVGVLPSSLQEPAVGWIAAVVDEATLERPGVATWRASGGRAGSHSPAMRSLLAELQQVARSHPGAIWGRLGG